MSLDVEVLDEMLTELETSDTKLREGPLSVKLGELDNKALSALSFLSQASGEANMNQLWQLEYTLKGYK